jgi:hypothetical protein
MLKPRLLSFVTKELREVWPPTLFFAIARIVCVKPIDQLGVAFPCFLLSSMVLVVVLVLGLGLSGGDHTQSLLP